MTAVAPAIPRFLERSVPFERSDDPEGDGRSFEGYAAVFGSPTRIDSWEGAFDEQIAKGAFKKSVRERTPVFQFDHGHHPMIGSIPIGAIKSVGEDQRGLLVKSRLHAAPFFEPVREAIDSGAINGMSFRFEVVKEDWHFRGKRLTDPDDVLRHIWRRIDDMGDDYVMRTLKELKVPELGPVVFPAYPDTTAAVRGREVINVIARNEDMVLQMRNSMARAMGAESSPDAPDDLVVEDVPDETPADATDESGDQTDSITPESNPEPVQPVVESEEAPEQIEPPAPEGHSGETGEPPAAGHSEPVSETPDTGRATQTEPVITATNLDSAERQLARKRIAAGYASKRAQANANLEKYSHG